MLLLIFVFSGISGCTSNPAAEDAALVSAKTWLNLVDNGKYAESWEEASGYFKLAVNKDNWLQTIQAVRKPFGKTLSRKLKNKKYTTSLPGAPDGEYVVIQFNTVFENKRSSVETVTPMLDKDNKWRVSGYYIK